MVLYTDRRDGRSYKKAVEKVEFNRARSMRKSKRDLSKKIRRYQGFIPDGNAYRKLFGGFFYYDWIYDMRFDNPDKLLEKDIITYGYNGENYLSK
ncbi:hypothetical protein C4561_04915 [candidate division WWE3 bacterium]|jgi:hypothetical protein|uniref:Uncharacterized protein n=1 Tax=candidate division WWE3 bacterium TaxID=2053526 RepID=A0A3A4ZAX7_UNCKA|nr:MAG: hypothetical protein C4561_04915 [candidate division WWE3 bacterium]